jgi:hypothetical protein
LMLIFFHYYIAFASCHFAFIAIYIDDAAAFITDGITIFFIDCRFALFSITLFSITPPLLFTFFDTFSFRFHFPSSHIFCISTPGLPFSFYFA